MVWQCRRPVGGDSPTDLCDDLLREQYCRDDNHDSEMWKVPKVPTRI